MTDPKGKLPRNVARALRRLSAAQGDQLSAAAQEARSSVCSLLLAVAGAARRKPAQGRDQALAVTSYSLAAIRVHLAQVEAGSPWRVWLEAVLAMRLSLLGGVSFEEFLCASWAELDGAEASDAVAAALTHNGAFFVGARWGAWQLDLGEHVSGEPGVTGRWSPVFIRKGGEVLSLSPAWLYDTEADAIVTSRAEEESLSLQVDDSAKDMIELAGGWIGPFRVIREIARGAQGVLFEAEQSDPRRRVALKTLTELTLDSVDARARFEEEGRVLAQIEHEGVVPIYDTGSFHAHPWIAMKLLRGRNLEYVVGALPADSHVPITEAQWAEASGELTRAGNSRFSYPRRVARLVCQVARALQACHARGVVHRDVKPANIMFEPDGAAILTDFGLARPTDARSRQLTRGIVGTLPYLPPEAVEALDGEDPIDARGDIFALGVSAYELLSRTRPYQAWERDPVALFRAVRRESATPLSGLCPKLPKDLEIIVAKCMRVRPDERYATAGDLADDLDRFLESRPIRASRPSRMRRAQLWSRRRPVLAGGAGVLILLCILLSAWRLDVAKRESEIQARTLKVRSREAREGRRSTLLGLLDPDPRVEFARGLDREEAVFQILQNADSSTESLIVARLHELVDDIDAATKACLRRRALGGRESDVHVEALMLKMISADCTQPLPQGLQDSILKAHRRDLERSYSPEQLRSLKVEPNQSLGPPFYSWLGGAQRRTLESGDWALVEISSNVLMRLGRLDASSGAVHVLTRLLRSTVLDRLVVPVVRALARFGRRPGGVTCRQEVSLALERFGVISHVGTALRALGEARVAPAREAGRLGRRCHSRIPGPRGTLLLVPVILDSWFPRKFVRLEKSGVSPGTSPIFLQHLGPQEGDLLWARAAAWSGGGEFGEAALDLRLALEGSPENRALILERLAIAHRLRGDLDIAAAIFGELGPGHRSSDVFVLKLQAICLAELGRHDDADRILSRIDAAQPGLVQVRYFRVMNEVMRGRYDIARDVASSPGEPGLGHAELQARAVASIALGDTQAALSDLEVAFVDNPEWVFTPITQAVAHLRLMDWEAATVANRLALDLESQLPYAWVNQGAVFLATDRAVEALRCYKRALALVPILPSALLGLGLAHTALGRDVDARRAYEGLLVCSPEDPVADQVRRYLEDLK